MNAIHSRRHGFTLIELLVAMSIIVLLASLALMVVPDIMSQDRTTEGAARLQQYLLMAKSRAARDGQPRGARLLMTTNPVNGLPVAKEVQFLETPPLYVPWKDPAVETTDTSDQLFTLNNVPGKSSIGAPRLEYATGANGAHPGTWSVYNLPAAAPALTNGCVVLVPGLGTYFTLTGGSTPVLNVNTTSPGVLPYPQIGVGTKIETYQFAIYGPPQPLLGEPVQQLPTNIGVDLISSSPASATDVDLIFTPAGDLLLASTGQVMLWVRDITKSGGDPASVPAANFATAGSQQVVSIKAKSGALGVFPIAWTKSYFQYAQTGATGP